MRADSYSEICEVAAVAIKAAAEKIGAKPNDVAGYYVAGGEWDATTAEELTDEIVRCWMEQAAAQYSYTIEQPGGAAGDASYQEIEMIEAATLLWREADDLPEGTEFARVDFGRVTFTVYRSQQ